MVYPSPRERILGKYLKLGCTTTSFRIVFNLVFTYQPIIYGHIFWHIEGTVKKTVYKILRFHTKCTQKVSLIMNNRCITKICNWIWISIENHQSILTYQVWQFHSKSRTTNSKYTVTNLYWMWPLSKHFELTNAWKDSWRSRFKSSTTKTTTLPWNSEWDSLNGTFNFRNLEGTEDKVGHV